VVGGRLKLGFSCSLTAVISTDKKNAGCSSSKTSGFNVERRLTTSRFCALGRNLPKRRLFSGGALANKSTKISICSFHAHLRPIFQKTIQISSVSLIKFVSNTISDSKRFARNIGEVCKCFGKVSLMFRQVCPKIGKVCKCFGQTEQTSGKRH
jgi:hypothetical protein